MNIRKMLRFVTDNTGFLNNETGSVLLSIDTLFHQMMFFDAQIARKLRRKTKSNTRYHYLYFIEAFYPFESFYSFCVLFPI